jgi:hypothetical protein
MLSKLSVFVTGDLAVAGGGKERLEAGAPLTRPNLTVAVQEAPSTLGQRTVHLCPAESRSS